MNKYLVVLIVGGLASLCAPASAGCLIRPFKDSNDVDRPFKVIIPDAEEGDYEARGYQSTSCGDVDLAAYRKKVCDLVNLGNNAVQNRLEEVLGMSPAKMCASAKLASADTLPVDPVDNVNEGSDGKSPKTGDP